MEGASGKSRQIQVTTQRNAVNVSAYCQHQHGRKATANDRVDWQEPLTRQQPPPETNHPVTSK